MKSKATDRMRDVIIFYFFCSFLNIFSYNDTCAVFHFIQRYWNADSSIHSYKTNNNITNLTRLFD